MPEARNKRTLKALWGALIAAALVVAPMVTAGASAAPKDKPTVDAVAEWPADTVGVKGDLVEWTQENNHADFWETYTGHEMVCYDGESRSHGSVTGNGLTVTLEEFDPEWTTGDHWELLVIKAGSDWNDVIVHPEAGVAYASPPNASGNQAQVSHWFVCKGTTPPEAKPDPISTQKSETVFVCASKVAQITTTTTTTDYLWDKIVKKWVLGTPVVSQPVVTERPLTAEELKTCPTNTIVTYGEWEDGTWVCGDTTVEQTRTVTTTVGEAQPVVTTETQTRDLTQEEIGTCPLVPGDIDAVCVGDVPYLGYGLTLPAGFVPSSSTPVTITFLNPDGEDYVVENQPLSGELLWPGASAGEPKMWPGWELVDGEYAQTDGNYAWTREGVTVRFEVNPTYSTEVQYPEASAECANPPIGGPEATPAAAPAASGDLAVTGGGVSPIVVAAGGAALAAGIAVVTIAAYRRRRAGTE